MSMSDCDQLNNAALFRKRCNGCSVAMINGVYCHEHGCPNAWRDNMVACKECDTKFVPQERGQLFCDTSCYAAYNGLPDPAEDDGQIICRGCGKDCWPYDEGEEFCSERCAKEFWG